MIKISIPLLLATIVHIHCMEQSPTLYTTGSSSEYGSWGCYHSTTLDCCTYSYQNKTYHDICADACEYSKNKSSSSRIKRTDQEKHELYAALQNKKAKEIAERAQRLMSAKRAETYIQHLATTIENAHKTK